MSGAAEPVLAAGAVLWRDGAASATGSLEVCVVHRPKYDDWSLSKGKADPGEPLVFTAVREVLEETGHAVALGRPLPQQRYEAFGRPKVVSWWAAAADPYADPWSGTKEIDRIEFLPVAEALARLTRPIDRDLVETVAADPAPTRTLVLLRHAVAVPRGAWSGTGPDLERPLSAAGEEQARRLVPVLRAYGIRLIVTSDALRCRATIEPYAAAAALPVEVDPRLAQDTAGPGDHAPDTVTRALGADEPVVLCTHRPVLPTLLHRLGLPEPDRTVAPSGCLVVHHRAGPQGSVVVAVERHEV